MIILNPDGVNKPEESFYQYPQESGISRVHSLNPLRLLTVLPHFNISRWKTNEPIQTLLW